LDAMAWLLLFNIPFNLYPIRHLHLPVNGLLI
jgi:hypothetical protein